MPIYEKSTDISNISGISGAIYLIHIPKTGGTCVHKTLVKNGLNASIYGEHLNHDQLHSDQHLTSQQLFNVRPPNPQDIVFAVVRNPYDRIVSEFYFYYNIVKRNPIPRDMSICDIRLRFSQFCKDFLSGRLQIECHHLPQIDYLTDKTGVIYPNIRILRTEKLGDDFKKLVGIDLNKDRVNPSKSKVEYLEHYDSETLKLVTDYYKRDFRKLGYHTKTSLWKKV